MDFDVDETKYDESNRFILLKDNGVDHKESKTKQRSKKEAKLKSQLLSKKKRKKLEKILERKNRKFNVTNVYFSINDGFCVLIKINSILLREPI